MSDKTIAVGIDPTRSTAGARVVKRDLEGIAAAAQRTESGFNRARDSLGRFTSTGGVANQNIQQMARATGSLNGVMSVLGTTLRNTVAGLVAFSGAAFVLAMVKYVDVAKNLDSQLRLVTKSTTEFAQANEKLYQISQETRSGLEGTVNLYTRLKRATSELGVSNDVLYRVTETINKSFKISGASTTETYNAIVQLNQGLASGALRGDEFNAVAEQSPRLLQAVAKSLNMNLGQLREYAAQGKITSQIIITALLGAAEEIDSEFGKLAPTISGSFTQIENAVIKAVGAIDQKLGFSDKVANGLKSIADGIDYLRINSDKLFRQLTLLSAVLSAMFAPAILTSITALATAVGTGLVGAFAALNAVILANPVVAVGVAIGAVVSALYYYRDEVQKAIGVDVWGIVKGTVNLIIAAFVAAFEDLKILWNEFPNIIEYAMMESVRTFVEKLNSIIAFTVDSINTLSKLVGGQKDLISYEDVLIVPPDGGDKRWAEDLLKRREEALKQAAGTDWLGKIFQWVNGTTGNSQPGMPTEDLSLPSGFNDVGTSEKDKKKYDKIITDAQQYMASQKAIADGLFMTEKAARALKLEQDLLNKVQDAGIKLTPQQAIQIHNLAGEMSSAAEKFKNMQEAMDFSKSTFKGFFSDIRSGVMEGKSLFESLANAVTNALNKIADKLMDLALDGIFDSIFKTGTGTATTAGSGASIASVISAAVTKSMTAPVIPVTRAPLADVGASAATGQGAELAWNFWKSKGLKDFQVAGVLGNIHGESAFNPSAIGDAGMAKGLYQWNDRGPDMMRAVPDWKTNPLGQHEYAYREMMSSESRAWGALTNSTDVRGATGAMAGFERPQGFSWQNPEGAHNFDGRLSAANDNLQKFAGTAENAGTTLESSVGTAAKGMTDLGSGMNKFGSSLSNMGTGGGGLGGFNWSSLFSSSWKPNTTLSGFLGLSGGGYTGPGGVNEPAGIVHRGEVVWSQNDVSRAGGVAAVDGMRRGIIGYAGGGSSGHASNSNMQSAGAMEVIVSFDEDGNPFARQREIAREEADALIDTNNRVRNRTFSDRLSKSEDNPRRRSTR